MHVQILILEEIFVVFAHALSKILLHCTIAVQPVQKQHFFHASIFFLQQGQVATAQSTYSTHPAISHFGP